MGCSKALIRLQEKSYIPALFHKLSLFRIMYVYLEVTRVFLKPKQFSTTVSIPLTL